MTNTAVINFWSDDSCLLYIAYLDPSVHPVHHTTKNLTVSNVVLAKSLRLCCRLHKTMTHNTWVVKSRVAFYIQMYNSRITLCPPTLNTAYWILYAFVSIYFKPAVLASKTLTLRWYKYQAAHAAIRSLKSRICADKGKASQDQLVDQIGSYCWWLRNQANKWRVGSLS